MSKRRKLMLYILMGGNVSMCVYKKIYMEEKLFIKVSLHIYISDFI